MSADRTTPSDLGYPEDLDLECPNGNSDDETLRILEELVEDTGSDRAGRVLERARGDRHPDRVAARDYQYTLKAADGTLALVSWTSAYMAAVGYVGGGQPQYDCFAYSKLDEWVRGPKAASTYESLFASDVRAEFEGRDPVIVSRDRTTLDEQGDL